MRCSNSILAYTQTNGTVELREAIAALYDGATAGQHPGHQRRIGSELDRPLASRRARRRDRDDDAELPAGGRHRARARRDGTALAPGSCLRRPPPLAARPRRPRLPRHRTDPRHRHLQPEQSDRRQFCGRRCGRHLPRCRANWRMGDRRRDLPRRGAGQRRDADAPGDATSASSSPTGFRRRTGCPGCRIGWVVGPPALVEELWGVHDYTTIAPGALSDRAARIALSPERREWILARTRGIVVTNYALVRRWIERREPSLWHAPPDAGAIAFVRYAHRIGSTALIERLRDERSVLVVPGDHFDMDGYLRIGFGGDPLALTRALDHIGEVLDTVPFESRPPSR